MSLKNEEEPLSSDGKIRCMSPHSLSPLLNNEALHELEDAAFFLLDEDDDHNILSSTDEKDDDDGDDNLKEAKKANSKSIIENTKTNINNYVMNAVHMEVQENAKVSTLPVSVNRSNSTAGTTLLMKPHYVREILDNSNNNNRSRERSLSIGCDDNKDVNANDVDEPHSFIEGFKIAEMFLHCNERESAALAYSNVVQNKLQIKSETTSTTATTTSSAGAQSIEVITNKDSSCPKKTITTAASSLTRNLYFKNNNINKTNKIDVKTEQKQIITNDDATETTTIKDLSSKNENDISLQESSKITSNNSYPHNQQNKGATLDNTNILSADAIATAAALASVQNLFHVIKSDNNEDTRQHDTVANNDDLSKAKKEHDTNSSVAVVNPPKNLPINNKNNRKEDVKVINEKVNCCVTAQSKGSSDKYTQKKEGASIAKNVTYEKNQATADEKNREERDKKNTTSPKASTQIVNAQVTHSIVKPSSSSVSGTQPQLIPSNHNLNHRAQQPIVVAASIPITNNASPQLNQTLQLLTTTAATIQPQQATQLQPTQPQQATQLQPTQPQQATQLQPTQPQQTTQLQPVQPPVTIAATTTTAQMTAPAMALAPIPPPFAAPSPAMPSAPQYYHPNPFAPTTYPPPPSAPPMFPPAPHYPFTTLMPTSILEASRRQNQFGFSNHFVPSVPPPPMKHIPVVPPPYATATHHSHPYHHMPMMPPVAPRLLPSSASSSMNKQTKTKTKTVTATIIDATTSTIASSSEVSASSSNNINSTIAYERKKQRAKDGRVKFNDAVDKLSIAISLAGDQAKNRSNSSSNIGNNNDKNKSLFKKQTLDTMMECSVIASTAKKYDRPSFLSTAAMLMQAMNAQCDALVQELVEVKKEKELLLQQSNSTIANSSSSSSSSASKITDNTAASSLKRKIRDDEPNNNNQLNNHDNPNDSSLTTSNNNQQITSNCTPPKRNKMIQDQTQITTTTSLKKSDYFSSISSHGPILQTISLYLDPLSLTRCICVSKYWNTIQQFQGDNTWKSLCVARFGQIKFENYYQQYQNNNNDNIDDNATTKKMMFTYKSMSLLSVKPYAKFINENDDKSIVRLGETKNFKAGVDTIVYMTQRSNGETLRSVHMENNIPIATSSSVSATNINDNQYTKLPIIELRILIQNYQNNQSIIIPTKQYFIVDKSTRRRNEELVEVSSKYPNDLRFEKSIHDLDGSMFIRNNNNDNISFDNNDVELRLFESIIFSVYIFARGCPTSSRFLNKAKFLKFIIIVNGITIPIVVPFDTSNNKIDCAALSVED